MNSNETLDAVKHCLGEVSDYRMCKELGLPSAHYYAIRRGTRKMTEKARIRAAEILGQEPAQQLMYRAIETSKDKKAIEIWKKLAATAAMILVSTVITLAPVKNVQAEEPLYIMLN